MTGTRAVAWVAALILATALLLTGCSESQPDDDAYHPAEIEEIDDSDVKKVTLTEDAASRIGLELATAQLDGTLTVVPYAALIYDGDGDSWVYEAHGDLTFVRAEVEVERIDGDLAWLSDGSDRLSPGTRVATVGATQLYGAELEIDAKH